MNLNKVFILGRLTRDPEQRTMPNGRSVSGFSIATNRIWLNPETREKQEQTQFHNIVAFGRLAEICNQYLTKGQLILIEGRLQTRSWQDQEGNKRSRTEVIAEGMQMGPRAGSSRTSEETSVPESSEEISIEEIKEEPEESKSAKKSPKKKGNPDGEIDVKDIPF